MKWEDYQQRYVYTRLGDASVGHTDPYSIYGVVLDATAPYVKNKPYCNVRLIDPSLNQRAASLVSNRANTFATCSFFANGT